MSDSNTIFDAAMKGDVETVRAQLDAGADTEALNEHGYTALHCAAYGANSAEIENILAVMKLLIDAGSNIEAVDSRGVTPLFLAAEFSQSVAPVQLLLDAGANPNVQDKFGNSIVENAMLPDVQQLLIKFTGAAASTPASAPARASVSLSSEQWASIEKRIAVVFQRLLNQGIVSLQDAGYTQEDGFADCSHVFQARGGEATGNHGICFYTRQDLERAQETSLLPLAIWGAPAGDTDDIARVGEIVVQEFRTDGFVVDWNGAASKRPTIYLAESQSGE